MKAPNPYELLQELDSTGGIEMSSLVLRVTAGLSEMFANLDKLRSEGLVRLKGDESAVRDFANHARELEQQGLEAADLEKEIFKALDESPEAAHTFVTLTKRGFLKARRL